jgi:hypothetical protein
MLFAKTYKEGELMRRILVLVICVVTNYACSSGSISGLGLEQSSSSVPQAPNSLIISTVSTSQLHLTWNDNSSDEAGFKIERMSGGDFVEIAIASENAVSWDDSGLDAATTYSYRVRAYNTVGDSEYSEVASGLTATVTPPPPPVTTGAIIINHTSVAAFDSIPAAWLEAAKGITLHYAHTSHGSQIISGIEALESADSTYSVAIRESTSEGLPPSETPAALRIYDGNPPETYIEPGDYWDGDDGMNRTRAVVNTNNYNFSMWSWCGQQSSNDAATVQRYLDNLNTLEGEFSAMRFIYMTGHTDGTDTLNTANTLKYNNNLVRQYVINNNKVLFDFADIESYDPDGTYYPTTSDACAWCTTWCTNHPSDCTNLTGSCAHSHPYNCKLKAKAFWYMMARLAGWDGN